MTLEITTPDARRFAKVLVFGASGAGKTHFLGTAQEDERTSPMLLLDFEGGEETLAGLDIDVAPIRSWDDYGEAYEILTDPNCPYNSIGLDSISETHIWALLAINADVRATRKEPDLLEMRDYGTASLQMRRLLREFRDLPRHVFFTSTAKEEEERKVGKVRKPSLAGQMADEVVALMSVVGYLGQEEDEEGEIDRILILQNDPHFRTKVRTPWGVVAPDELINPSVTSLLDMLDIQSPTKRKRSKKQED